MRSRVHPLDVPALRAQVRAFEDQYGVPSERMFEAFTVDDVFVETDDFLEWTFAYDTLKYVEETRG